MSAIAIRSKAHWGYDPAFIAQCAEELRVTPLVRDYFQADVGGVAVGFYSLEARDDGAVELEALFIDPEHIGKGFGKQLFHHAVLESRRRGFKTIVIQSDPRAGGFYEAMGCVRSGERASGSIPGRSLPLFTFVTPDPEVVSSC